MHRDYFGGDFTWAMFHGPNDGDPSLVEEPPTEAPLDPELQELIEDANKEGIGGC
jgi:hypothetical protein